MTEQSNADLIAESREVARQYDPAFRFVLTRVIDRLEEVAKDSAEGQYQHAYWQRRAEDAERENADWALTLDQVMRERDNWKLSAEEAERAEERWKDRAHDYSTDRNQLSAVIEQAEDYVTRHYLDTRFGDEVLPILATAPADALRERDAKVRAEGREQADRERAKVLREVTEHWRGHIDTHSESCWKWHAACLARVLRDMEDQ